jgi:prephenate dehydrogenase
MQVNKLAIIGVGLLGGSLGLALRQRKDGWRVEGCVRRAEAAEACLARGVVDWAGTDLEAVVAGADVVVLTTPIAQMGPLVERCAPVLKPGAVVTDVGSVKRAVIEVVEPLVTRFGGRFVGGHPMAGGERMGVEAARADLFVGATCVVTPTLGSDAGAVALVEELWRSVGGRPLRMDAEVHDAVVARSSHLPHVIAAALAHLVLDPEAPEAQSALCANGFRDTTRIASGSPEMWRDISLANRRQMLAALDAYIERLREVRRGMDAADGGWLEAFFQTARGRREQWRARRGTGSTTSE